ncbi:MAG: hypothetical protein Q8O95_05010 [bacterium]|nr:hypothetical protein [bacterium]
MKKSIIMALAFISICLLFLERISTDIEARANSDNTDQLQSFYNERLLIIGEIEEREKRDLRREIREARQEYQRQKRECRQIETTKEIMNCVKETSQQAQQTIRNLRKEQREGNKLKRTLAKINKSIKELQDSVNQNDENTDNEENNQNEFITLITTGYEKEIIGAEQLVAKIKITNPYDYPISLVSFQINCSGSWIDQPNAKQYDFRIRRDGVNLFGFKRSDSGNQDCSKTPTLTLDYPMIISVKRNAELWIYYNTTIELIGEKNLQMIFPRNGFIIQNNETHENILTSTPVIQGPEFVSKNNNEDFPEKIAENITIKSINKGIGTLITSSHQLVAQVQITNTNSEPISLRSMQFRCTGSWTNIAGVVNNDTSILLNGINELNFSRSDESHKNCTQGPIVTFQSPLSINGFSEIELWLNFDTMNENAGSANLFFQIEFPEKAFQFNDNNNEYFRSNNHNLYGPVLES